MNQETKLLLAAENLLIEALDDRDRAAHRSGKAMDPSALALKIRQWLSAVKQWKKAPTPADLARAAQDAQRGA